jgi:hypothetical protein
LAAFGRRPPVDAARLSLAGIRNPAQSRHFAHIVSAAALAQRPDSPAEEGRFRVGPKAK